MLHSSRLPLLFAILALWLPAMPFAQGSPAPRKDFLAEGNKLYEKGAFEPAAALYLEAIKARQNLAFAWFNLANCRVQQKQYHKAIVSYRRSLEEAPLFSRAWQMLGDMYYLVGSYGEATVCYRRVLEIDGPSLRPYQMLGECALKGGDLAEALKNFETALALEPDQGDLRLALAETYAQVRDYEKAQKTLEEAVLLSGAANAQAFFYLGQLYEKDGQYPKAIRAYEEGLLLDPKAWTYHLRIARLYQERGQDFMALFALEQALKAGVDRREIRLERAIIFTRQKRVERAREEMERAGATTSINFYKPLD